MNIQETNMVLAVPVKKKFTDVKKGAAKLDTDARFYPQKHPQSISKR